jgi:hypothetical protein
MAEPGVQDLLGLDRDVARGAAALARWREALAHGSEAIDEGNSPAPGRSEEGPFEGVRHVASRSTWVALGETSPSAADAPLRDALRGWVVALTQARIAAPAELAWARAASAAGARLESEPPRWVSWREAWRGIVAAAGVKESSLFLDAAAAVAPAVAEAAAAAASRRLEVARRFGMEHPWAGLLGVGAGALRAAARQLLDSTEAIAQEAWRPVWRAHGEGAAATLHEAVARGAGEGWPPRLTSRWIAEVFPPQATRAGAVSLEALPAALGAASFARALGAFGRAVQLSGGPAAPFALACSPAPVAAHRLGFVFAGLVTDAEWHVRALGVGRRTAMAQARVLARSALLEARLHAARILLGDEAAFAPAEVFDELGLRLFGAPLDGRLRGAWPGPRHDEPARLVALLQALETSQALRERFDADWYRNPRAWGQLRALGAAPAREGVEADALIGRASALARAFEEALA